ncbi:MAG: hypothetical protein DMG93_09560 [Acidobacteria bacterium]|nr:MAG: hypothetical protein DMG93_09560 [Acidobacteriota bacterium]
MPAERHAFGSNALRPNSYWSGLKVMPNMASIPETKRLKVRIFRVAGFALFRLLAETEVISSHKL